MANKKHKTLESITAIRELEKLLDGRIREVQAGHVIRRTAKEIYALATRKRVK